MKKISIVIPAYNAEAYLRETLDSVLAQDYPSIEIVVVDDGSKDGTAAVCKSYGERVVYRHQPNSGGCSAPRNHGYRVASGDYICFFDADDLMVPGRLSGYARFLGEHPDAVAVLADYRNFDENGPAPKTHFETCPQLCKAAGFDDPSRACAVLDGATVRSILVEENFSISSSPMYRREVLELTHAFDETLKASEDFDLVYRVSRAGSWGIMRRVGFNRRLHQNNMSWDSPRIIEYKIRSRAKLLVDETVPEQRRKLKRALGGLYRSSALLRAKARSHSWLRELGKSASLAASPGLIGDFLRCLRYQYFSSRGA